MHLTPRDIDKLLLHNAGFLAQKRLARGLRLGYPETVALLATQLLELIRDGRSVAELMDVGRRILGRRQVLTATVQRRTGDTIYMRLGDGPFVVGASLALLAAWLLTRRSSSRTDPLRRLVGRGRPHRARAGDVA